MKKKYDFAFGLGMACSCTQTLREAGLQFMSFPYDWLTLISSSPEAHAGDLPRRTREVAEGFPTWFAKEDFRHVATNPVIGKEQYAVDRLGLLFNHDFLLGASFDETFPQVNATYRRRITRLLECIRNSKSVLVLRLDRPDVPFSTDEADCRLAQQTLRNAFPGIRFDIFHFAYEKGRAFADRRTEDLGDGLTRVTFDYHNYSPGSKPYEVNRSLTAGLLRELFEVSDYRTAEDKRLFALERKRRRWQKVGAHNAWEYFWLRLRASIRKRIPSKS